MAGTSESPESNPLRASLPRARVPDPCAIVLFGATGDLTHRKLAPALYRLAVEGQLPAEYAVVGFARRDWDDDRFREELHQTLAPGRRARVRPDLEALRRPRPLQPAARSTTPPPTTASSQTLERADADLGTRGNRLYYLAVAPSSSPRSSSISARPA